MTESCRLITEEQYQEYLKLKEEHKPLSWEELKEEAKKMGWYTSKSFVFNNECFDLIMNEDGTIEVSDQCGGSWYLSTDRTPEQMFAIMKALQ